VPLHLSGIEVQTAAVDDAPNSRVEFVPVVNRKRPLLDGRGKVSPGKMRPDKRSHIRLNPVSAILLGLAQASSVHSFTISAVNKDSWDACHPVPEWFVKQGKEAVVDQYCLCLEQDKEAPAGQPLTLQFLSNLAKEAGDCYWQCLRTTRSKNKATVSRPSATKGADNRENIQVAYAKIDGTEAHICSKARNKN
jgi:hypothetical protein